MILFPIVYGADKNPFGIGFHLSIMNSHVLYKRILLQEQERIKEMDVMQPVLQFLHYNKFQKVSIDIYMSSLY